MFDIILETKIAQSCSSPLRGRPAKWWWWWWWSILYTWTKDKHNTVLSPGTAESSLTTRHQPIKLIHFRSIQPCQTTIFAYNYIFIFSATQTWHINNNEYRAGSFIFQINIIWIEIIQIYKLMWLLTLPQSLS